MVKNSQFWFWVSASLLCTDELGSYRKREPASHFPLRLPVWKFLRLSSSLLLGQLPPPSSPARFPLDRSRSDGHWTAPLMEISLSFPGAGGGPPWNGEKQSSVFVSNLSPAGDPRGVYELLRGGERLHRHRCVLHRHDEDRLEALTVWTGGRGLGHSHVAPND